MALEGQVAIVTGGGRGIGRAIARAVTEAGASIVVCSRTREEVDAVAEELRELGGAAVPIVTDVSDPESVDDLVATTLEEFGRVDVLVNNAGVWIAGGSDEYSVDDWETTMAINARGPFLCAQRVYEPMREQGGGIIINISSIRGLEGYPRMAAYSASKFAVNGLTEALSREWNDDGIRVNAVCPGPVDTGYATGQPRNEARILPEDVADLVTFLASDDAEYVNGEAIVVSKQDFAYERYDE